MLQNFPAVFCFHHQICHFEASFFFPQQISRRSTSEALSLFKFSRLSPSSILSLQATGGVGRRGVDAAAAQCGGHGEDDVVPELILQELSGSFSGYTLLHFSRSLMKLMGREKFTQRCGLGICSRVSSEDTPITYMSCLDNQLVTIGTHCIDFVRTLKWRLPLCSSTALTKEFKLIFVSLTRTMLVFVVQQVNKLYCSILVILC